MLDARAHNAHRVYALRPICSKKRAGPCESVLTASASARARAYALVVGASVQRRVYGYGAVFGWAP